MKPNQDCKEFSEAITVEEMRRRDAYTIEHYVPGRELMYRAAMGVFQNMEWENKKVAVVSGSGNNGGDGYALAWILAEHGYTVDLYRTSQKLSDDGAYFFEKCLEKGIRAEFSEESTVYDGYDVIVDCILGTGFQGVPRGAAADAIIGINKADAYVISVDINSGMNGDTGEAELAVKSQKTVSIGFFKKGHFLGKAPTYIGDLVNVDIGIVSNIGKK